MSESGLARAAICSEPCLEDRYEVSRENSEVSKDSELSIDVVTGDLALRSNSGKDTTRMVLDATQPGLFESDRIPDAETSGRETMRLPAGDIGSALGRLKSS